MVRAAAISLLMLCMVVTMLPLMPSEASSGERSAKSSHRRHKMKRHSRAWWRHYRARMRRRRMAMLRHQKALAQNPQYANANPVGKDRVVQPTEAPRATWSVTMPAGWSSRPEMVNGDMNFKVLSNDGRRSGLATLTVVGSAQPQSPVNSIGRAKRESVGGVQTANLRRLVIDRMLKEDGWVVNDYQRELGGRKVFVVIARTPGSAGAQQAQVYYFTEVNGRIFSLKTNVPVDMSDKVATDSEQVMAAFNRSASAIQAQASLR